MTTPENGKGAKRRSGIPMRATTSAPKTPEMRRILEDGQDSGLSSECTTPTNGSPPPRQPKQQEHAGGGIPVPRRKMVDIIAASKARLQESERLNNRATRLLHSRSSTESARSLDSTRSRQVFSPLRPPRNVQSPSIDSGDEGSVRLERGTYTYMFQDIVSIKTMLLKLKRVLQESGENDLTRTETLNPFDNSLKNGLFYDLNDGNSTTDTPNEGRNVADELTDLRRQVVFLQGQVDDKDRTIQSLQAQLNKYQNAQNSEQTGDVTSTLNGRSESPEMTNAATQTEKLRPVSAGPSILQGLSQDNGMGPLVSWNDSWTSQHQIPSPIQKPELSSSSSTSSISSTSKLSSRRSSESHNNQQVTRPSSLRGLRLPNGTLSSPESSQKLHAARTKSVESDVTTTTTTTTRSAIPTPRRLASSTLIPRSQRAVSATGRAHNS